MDITHTAADAKMTEAKLRLKICYLLLPINPKEAKLKHVHNGAKSITRSRVALLLKRKFQLNLN